MCYRLVLAVALLMCAESSADDDFHALFNGRDLTGWTYDGQKLDGMTKTPDGRFLVEGGAIVAAEGKGIKVLNTSQPRNGDFVLALEFRAGPKADSGVYVRGPQLQIRDFLRRKEQSHLKDVFKDDGWNELEVAVSGNQIVTAVNGKALKPTDTLELTVRQGEHSAKLNGKELEINSVVTTRGLTVCKIGGVVFDTNFRAGPKGPIGLQAETGKFEFRNVRVK